MASAQLAPSVDLGVARAKYPGYLPTTLASLSPAVSWLSPRMALDARGTLVAFESGNTSLQGEAGARVAGPSRPAPWGLVRLGFAATGGASRYRSFATLGYASGSARLEAAGVAGSLWLEAGPGFTRTAGRTVRGDALALGASRDVGVAWLDAEVRRSSLGDTAYADATLGARARWGRIDAYAAGGTRFASRYGGRGLYAESALTIRLTRAFALVASGGLFPSDPTRGATSGRYGALAVSAGRARGPARPHAAVAPTVIRALLAPAWRAEGEETGALGAGSGGVPRLDVRLGGRVARFSLCAPGSRTAELAADFTGWQPTPLVRHADCWTLERRLPAGVYRLSVRLDGGAWLAPAGLPSEDDDLGGRVAVLVVR